MELMLDSSPRIGRSGKVYFRQHKPRLHPEPVLVPDAFVDGTGASIYGTVLNDGGRLRMWYQAWPQDWNGANIDLVGYAESDNGIDWHKPRLGLVDYGGKDNNLIDLSGHPVTVFIDPEASPSHRYRATMCTGGTGHQGVPRGLTVNGYYTAHSADGLRWTYDQASPRWHSADVITSIYHPGQRRGVAAMKYTPFVNGILRRAIWTAELKDGVWSDSHSALIPDEFDDIVAVARGYVSGDYYGMGMMPAGSSTVGFVWQFRHNLPRTQGNGCGVFGVMDVSLAYQIAPGDRWLHAPGRPDFISHEDTPWGHGGIYTASCPVDVGDEQRLYFCSARESHGWYVNDAWQINETLKQSLIDRGMGRIGFASWPKNRLFSLQADPEGIVTLRLGAVTRPSQLILNVRTDAGGSIFAEIPNMPGYERTASRSITGDHLEVPVAWQAGTRLPVDPARPIQVNLHLHRAEIFAYKLEAH